VEVQRPANAHPGNEDLPPAAFTNAVGTADSPGDFRARVEDYFVQLGYRVKALEDVEPVSDRLKESAITDSWLLDAIEDAIQSHSVCTGSWHVWEDDED